MNWRDRLLPASFRGVGFWIDQAKTPVGRKGQLHEYPQRDLPFFEDLGQQARIHDVTAFITRSDMSMVPTALASCFFESLSTCETTLADSAVCLTVTDQALISLCIVLKNVSTDAQVSAWAGSAAHAAEPIKVGFRSLDVVQASQNVLWCRYFDLCEQPFAAMDFMALCDTFSAILLGDVPNLSAQKRAGRIARGTEDGVERVVAGDRELPQLSVHDDGVRRFIALVDECYDRKVPLYLEAQVPMDSLYTEGYLEFPFRRTLSRLQEMQLQRFAEA